jgi:hypothetical protein
VGDPLHGDDERLHCPEWECDEVVGLADLEELAEERNPWRMHALPPGATCGECGAPATHRLGDATDTLCRAHWVARWAVLRRPGATSAKEDAMAKAPKVANCKATPGRTAARTAFDRASAVRLELEAVPGRHASAARFKILRTAAGGSPSMARKPLHYKGGSSLDGIDIVCHNRRQSTPNQEKKPMTTEEANMTEIHSFSDLRDRLDPLWGSAGWSDPSAPTGDPCADSRAVLTAVTELVCSLDHPEWGDDWTEFVEALDLDDLQEQALSRLRPAGQIRRLERAAAEGDERSCPHCGGTDRQDPETGYCAACRHEDCPGCVLCWEREGDCR